MSLRVNCWDNALAESFSNLKSEKIKRKSYPTRAEAMSGYLNISRAFIIAQDAIKSLSSQVPLSSKSGLMHYEESLEK